MGEKHLHLLVFASATVKPQSELPSPAGHGGFFVGTSCSSALPPPLSALAVDTFACVLGFTSAELPHRALPDTSDVLSQGTHALLVFLFISILCNNSSSNPLPVL